MLFGKALISGVTSPARPSQSWRMSLSRNTIVRTGWSAPRSVRSSSELLQRALSMTGRVISSKDDRWDYLWDGENRLREMRTDTSAITSGSADSLRIVFDYDHQGRRIRKQVYTGYVVASPTSGTLQKTILFVWDGWHCLAELNGANSRQYVWGADMAGGRGGAGGVGGLVFINALNASYAVTQTHSPAYDGNGNVTALVQLTGTGVQSGVYEYDAFGNEVRHSGTFADGSFREFNGCWEKWPYLAYHRRKGF